MKKKLVLFFCAVLFFNFHVSAGSVSENKPEMRGADISFFDEIESLGGKYKCGGIETELFEILKKADVNWIRLRLWVNPEHGWCNLERTIEMAKRIKAYGFKFLLDIHYSDFWADPSKQTVPAKWTGLTQSEIEKKIGIYTKDVMDAFIWAECMPDMVQTGNEITNGMLWPYGSTAGGNMKNLMNILSSAVSSVRDAAPSVQIMIHLDRGGDYETASWWFKEARKAKLDYDVIGLSYYPFFHGTDLNKVSDNIRKLRTGFKKDVLIVETSYPWSFGWNDNTVNQIGEGAFLIPDCPATVKGQALYLAKLEKAVTKAGGKGIFWWEPDSISTAGFNNALENQAWFDFNGNWNGIKF